MPENQRNITRHDGSVPRTARELILCQKGCVVWFTGLSGSGKSTVARAVESMLTDMGHLCYVLDGDNIRGGLNADLGFTPGERAENIRRIGEVAALFADAGIITLTAFISPYRTDRDRTRRLVGTGRFAEVFVDTPVEVCESRDPKGLYRKARSGTLHDFTGIDAPYEPPSAPELTITTVGREPGDCAADVMAWLDRNGLLEGP